MPTGKNRDMFLLPAVMRIFSLTVAARFILYFITVPQWRFISFALNAPAKGMENLKRIKSIS
jgi:hypothetical protein